MTFLILIIAGVVLILGTGILVVAAMRRSQGVVPGMADRQGTARVARWQPTIRDAPLWSRRR